MVGSNVLVNILKPVNIVNLGNTLRCGAGKSGLEEAAFEKRGSTLDRTSSQILQ